MHLKSRINIHQHCTIQLSLKLKSIPHENLAILIPIPPQAHVMTESSPATVTSAQRHVMPSASQIATTVLINALLLPTVSPSAITTLWPRGWVITASSRPWPPTSGTSRTTWSLTPTGTCTASRRLQQVVTEEDLTVRMRKATLPNPF